MDDEEADGFFEAAFFGKVEKVIKHCAYPIYGAHILARFLIFKV